MNAATIDAAGTWLGFDLAGQHYAVPLTDVREIIHQEEPTPVPGAPSDVVGIINVRGTIVTVLDGCNRLGLAAGNLIDGPNERLMIFYSAGEEVGMRVDALRDVLELDGGELLPPPSGRAARPDDPVLGAVHRDGGFIALLDTHQLCLARAPTVEGKA